MNEYHATDTSRCNSISRNHRAANDVLVLPEDTKMLDSVPHFGIGGLLPFVKCSRGANNVPNLIRLKPCANHDTKSNTADHGDVALLKQINEKI